MSSASSPLSSRAPSPNLDPSLPSRASSRRSFKPSFMVKESILSESSPSTQNIDELSHLEKRQYQVLLDQEKVAKLDLTNNAPVRKWTQQRRHVSTAKHGFVVVNWVRIENSSAVVEVAKPTAFNNGGGGEGQGVVRKNKSDSGDSDDEQEVAKKKAKIE